MKESHKSELEKLRNEGRKNGPEEKRKHHWHNEEYTKRTQE